MRRPILMAALALAVVLVSGCLVVAQEAPVFGAGFQLLADQIPDVAGEPIEAEQLADNGDSSQQTTTGRMMWRKADNWTAFTGGSTTWILTPEGVVDRPNNVRFVWETEVAVSTSPTAAPAPTPVPPPAPTSVPSQQYSAEVKPMDAESGGPGVTVRRLMTEIDSDWAQSWGWRPSRPTTVYLFTGGFHLASGLPGITGQPLSAEQSSEYAANAIAVNVDDAQTGGYGIAVNIGLGMGTADWESMTKATIARKYAYLMEREAAGSAGPTWYREGLVRLAADSKAPLDPVLRREVSAMYELNRRGQQPTIRRLQQDWGGFVSISSGHSDGSSGMSFLGLQLVSGKVGRSDLLEVLRRTGRGEDFEAVLKAVTGYTIEQLDTDIKAKL